MGKHLEKQGGIRNNVTHTWAVACLRIGSWHSVLNAIIIVIDSGVALKKWKGICKGERGI